MATIFKPQRVQKETHQTLYIDKHDHAGNGLCLNKKPIVVVPNALQGETCEVRFTKQSKKVNFAQATKVLDASVARVTAFCEYFGQCGGCSLQHTSAKNGLALKEQALHDFVAKNLNGAANNIDANTWTTPVVSDIDYESSNENDHSDTITGYRRRIRLAVDARNKSSIKIGFRAANTQKIIDIETCSVALSSINECLPQIRSVLKQLPSINKVGHITVTQGDNKLQVTIFVTQKLCNKSLHKLEQLAHSTNSSILVSGKAVEPIVFQLPALNQEQGAKQDAVLIEDKPKITLSIKSAHFLQINKAVNQKMITKVHEWLVPNAKHTLYDFFCGSGNFALSLAGEVRAVKGFEGVNEMVQVASENAQYIGINNCQFITMDLSSQDDLKQLSFDEQAIVMLDPSREGAAELCQFLASSQVDKIVYVSCNPNSFVRDAAFLLPQYRIDKITALDMFPFTKHIELMALFVKQ
jgi:23S rRNA (uracil1939-C5)-methyltransferase